MPPISKPLLPSCFLTWTEPPDENGDERFRIVSWRRSFTLKGHSFREFSATVLPLLNGQRTLEEIFEASRDTFEPEDLTAALEMLAAQGIVVDGLPDAPGRLQPQLNYFSEVAPEGRASQQRLADARVVVFGMGGAGAALTRSLGAAGVGTLVCADPYDVTEADVYFSGLFDPDDIGKNRSERVVAGIERAAPEVRATFLSERLDDIAALRDAVDEADIVACCLESGDLNRMLKVSRACRAGGIRLIAGALEGPLVVAGPGIPAQHDGPCYMCYRMREVACAGNPESRFGLERKLDRTKHDLGARRENLVFGADLLAGFLGAEMINVLTGMSPPALDGRIIELDLTTLQQRKHVILRKPGCPVCSEREPG